MQTATEVIPSALAGERIDRVVSMITGLSRAEAALVVAGGGVRIGEEVVRAKARRVALDDEVRIDWEPPSELVDLEPDGSVTFEVVHEDDDVLIIDKPAGLVVHPGAGNDERTLVHGLLARYPEIRSVGQPDRPGIVHRLDKETSGLLAVARSPVAYDALVGALSDRLVDRRYCALAWGRFDTPAGLIDAPIGRSAKDPTKMAVTERGKDARTRYRVREEHDGAVETTLVECALETGRTHQIRVHLLAVGHPVVGDDRYHGVRESLVVPRLFLHAEHLAFDHPVSGERVEADAPLPADLAGVLERVRAGG